MSGRSATDAVAGERAGRPFEEATGGRFGGYIPFGGLARAFGRPPVSGVLRRDPDDFRVTEDLGFEPGGEGSHHWLQVRKTELTTMAVARLLAERYAVRARDVGFSGLKDRRAETTQWYSVPAGPRAPDPRPGFVAEGVRIVRATRGRRKLRRGVHAGNHFTIAVREVRGERAELAARLALVSKAGVPGYFGAQRFGRDGGNVEGAARLLGGGEETPNRHVRGLYLSAARSLLFNRVLHHRVEAGSWDAWLPGDAILITGRRRALAPGASPREGGCAKEWVEALRAHPTGPLWGRGASAGSAGEALSVEREALAGCEGWKSGLESAGLLADRRALRVVPSGLDWTNEGSGGLVLRFSLPRGAYATAVLRELVREPPGASTRVAAGREAPPGPARARG